MTKEARALKIACLICMFAGVFVTGASIYLIVSGGAEVGPDLTCGVGAAALIGGAQCARLVNVPSNAGSIRTLGIILLLLAGVVLGVGFGLELMSVPLLAMCGTVACLALVVAFLAHRLVKELKKV